MIDGYVEYGASAFDTCNGSNLPVSVGGDMVNPDVPGTYSVDYEATDDCGNTSQTARIVIVQDTTPPNIDCPADAVLECPADTSPSETGYAIAVDECGEVDITYTDVETPECGGAKTIAREWLARDMHGNESQCVQTINVEDTAPPVVTPVGPASMTLECHVDNYVEQGATAVDTCEGSLTVSVEGDVVNTDVPGTYYVVYATADDCGNVAEATRIIVVQDTIPPTITLGGNTNARVCSVGGSYIDIIPATAQDICAGDLPTTGRVIDSDNPNLSLPMDIVGNSVLLPEGTHVLEWSATDPSGNSASETETLRVASGIFAENGIDIRDRVTVLDAEGGGAPITNAGAGKTDVGTDASLGSILSDANIEIRDRSHVFGDINSASSITLRNQVIVEGDVNGNRALWITAPPPVSVTFPPPGQSDVLLEPDQSWSIGPGSYRNITIQPRATLTLEAGVYYVQNLDVESQATVLVNGLVTIYVSASWICRGNIANAENSHFFYLGTSQLFIEVDLNTHLSAPNAWVTIRTDFRGTLTAETITADAGSSLTCVPCADCV